MTLIELNTTVAALIAEGHHVEWRCRRGHDMWLVRARRVRGRWLIWAKDAHEGREPAASDIAAMRDRLRAAQPADAPMPPRLRASWRAAGGSVRAAWADELADEDDLGAWCYRCTRRAPITVELVAEAIAAWPDSTTHGI